MPELPTRSQQPSPVSPQVPVPNDFPAIPQEVIDRFPSARDWQRRLNEFWTRTNQALQNAQSQTARQVNSQVTFSVDTFRIYLRGVATPMFALDDTGIRLGNVLVINTPGRKVYIGAGNYQNDDTPFYIDTLGKFSLGANMTWDPDTATLTITGIINATSGTIGGFTIGADYIRDVANSFGLASTVGVGDVRFWAGATFANRYTAPLRFNEDGSGLIGGFTLTTSTLSAGTGITKLLLTSNSTTSFILGDSGFGSIQSGIAAGGFAEWSIYNTSSVRVGSMYTAGAGSAGYFAVNTAAGAASVVLDGANSLITFLSDTNLYRSAANTLKTDDAFISASTLQGTVITSTVATGTAPLTVTSTTVVGNLNVSQLLGATWAAPGTIGSGTPNSGAFTSLSATALAGAGTRTVVVDAAGVMSAP